MQKPASVEGPVATGRWMARQAWSDLKSVYYANTPVWRVLKSGALFFMGFFVWASASVVLSIEPGWTFLYLFLAYGFLLVFWGPLTHLAVVPLVLRLRRRGTHPVMRFFGRHGSKLNLAVFLTLVVVLAVVQPGFMLLEFSPSGDGPSQDVRGSLECDGPVDGMITCEVSNPAGFDHAVVRSGGEIIDRADEEPYRLEFAVAELEDGDYRVELRDADGSTMRTFRRSV